MIKRLLLLWGMCWTFFYGQGLYTQPGENASMIELSVGTSEYGKYNHFQAGFSYRGRLDARAAYHAATYRTDGLTRNFWIFGLEYFLLKGRRESDFIFSTLLNYGFGKFRGDENYTGDWDRTGRELELGVRIGQRTAETLAYVFIPSLELDYYWQELVFEDFINDYKDISTAQGYRITLRIDNAFIYKPDVSFTFTPLIKYGNGFFIYALDVGFLWGKIQ